MSVNVIPNAVKDAAPVNSPEVICTCSLSKDDPKKPPVCICKYKEDEIWENARMPKFTPEDIFYLLCAVFWHPGSEAGKWNDTILYHFVCEGDVDFIQAKYLVNSMMGEFLKSEYCGKLTNLEPGQSWDIYDLRCLQLSPVLEKADFVIVREEVPDESDDDYDVDLADDEHLADDGDLADDPTGIMNPTNRDDDAFDFESTGGGARPGLYDGGAEHSLNLRDLAADLPAQKAPVADNASQMSFPHSQGISCASCKERGIFHKQDDHGPGGEQSSGLNHPKSRASTIMSEEPASNNAPAPAVVNMINSWAPALSRNGGEVRISRYGSASIKFPPGRDSL